MTPAEEGRQDPQREMAAYLLAAAQAGGVERLWFCSGSDLTSLQEAAARARSLGEPAPQLVTSVHEHVALSAAMGDTMVRRAPAMTAAHADLGLLNYGGSLHNALRGSYPVLILTGYAPTTPEHRTSEVYWKQQRWDQGEVVRQYTKWDYRLSAHDDPSVIISRALQVALSPPRGPVYLAMPAECGRVGVALDHLTTLAELGVPAMGGGDPDQVDLVAARLLAAQQPLVLTDRIGADPEAVGPFAQLAEEFGLGVEASRHRMNLPDDHPSRRHGWALGDADVVLALDHPVPWIPAHRRPAPDAWVAVAGPDPIQTEIPLLEHRADLRLHVEARRFVDQLAESMRRQATASQRERARQRTEAWRARVPEAYAPASSNPEIDDITSALAEILSPDDLVCWEKVDTSRLARTRPGTLFEKGGSSLGWAMSAAIGARVASGDAPTVAMTGDGSYMFGVPHAAIWQQYQCDAPVLTIVRNNRGYSTGTSTLARHYPDGYSVTGADFRGGRIQPPPDHAAHARSQGGFGEKVTERSQLYDALVAARKAVEVDRVPAVVDVWTKPFVSDDNQLF